MVMFLGPAVETPVSMPRLPPSIPLLPLLLVVVLVVAPVGAVVPGSAPAEAVTGTASGTEAVTDAGNRTNYLMPDTETVREEYATASADVAGAVTAGAAKLHGRFERGSFRRAWTGSSELGKRRLVRTEFAEIRARLEALEADREALWRSYRTGVASTATFLRRSLVLHVRSVQLEERWSTVQNLLSIASEPPHVQDYLLPIRALESRTIILQDPVAETVEDPLFGRTDSKSLYVLFSEDSLVLAETSGGELTRLAHDSSSLVRNGTDQFADNRVESARARFTSLYPWADRNALGSSLVFPFGNTSIYRGEISHPQGDLTAFLDGSTRNVFREHQDLTLDSVPIEGSLSNNTAELAIRVNTTVPTGPMYVELEQSGTRAPVDGTVRIDGTVVGTTGESGSLWTVQPRDSFTVNATWGNETIAVSGP
jgi:hypothetical protein